MKWSGLGWRVVVVTLGWLLTASCARAGYVTVDLGVLPGGSVSAGTAINGGGSVAGWAETFTGATHAVALDPGTGRFDDLGVLPGGRFSFATGISNAGVVVGDSDVATGPFQFATHAFRTGGAGLQDLGVLPDGTDSHATGINGSGQVAGYGGLPGGVTHAFVTDPSGKLIDLGTLPGGASSLATGINASGIVVGSATTPAGIYHAVVSGSDGGLHEIGTIDGGTGSSFGTAINDQNIVVGYAGVIGGDHAFRSRPDGSLQDLGTLGGTTSSFATAVNDHGDVVGYALANVGPPKPFVYTDAIGLVDLNTLIDPNSGWLLTTASGINDFGQITGTGQINGQTHAFRLDPTSIPEPPALMLATLGLAVVLAWRTLTRRVRGGG